MTQLQDEMFSLLVEKTRALGRPATFSEVEEDERLPHANDYAYYYGSFTEASKKAWSVIESESNEKIRSTVKFKPPVRGIGGIEQGRRRKDVMGKQQNSISSERREEIISEIVDMFIENDGRMPSDRELKKNQYISMGEIAYLRRANLIRELDIRRRAEEKTGRTFLTREGRLRKEAEELRKKKVKAAKITEGEKTEVTKVTTDIATSEEPVEKPVEAKEDPVKVEEISVKEEVQTKEDIPSIEKVIKEEIQMKKGTPSLECIKRTLREFGEENLRWPTDKEIHEFSQSGIEGWASSAHIYRQLGPKATWADQIFPEGLPPGFVEDQRKGRNTQSKEGLKESEVPSISYQATEAYDTKNGIIEISSDGMEISIPVTLTIPKGVMVSGEIRLEII